MMVANIMKNERRWGDLEARKSIVVDYKLGKVTKNNGNRCSAYVPEHHEAIVSPEIARAAHLVASSRKKCGVQDIVVIQQGTLKGFVGIHPNWSGISVESIRSLCLNAYLPEEVVELNDMTEMRSGKKSDMALLSDYLTVSGTCFINQSMTNVLTAFSCQRAFVIFYLLNSDITGGVVHNYAFSCIHRHIRCRQRKCAWNLDGAHAVVVNAEPLLPYTVDLFCIEHFDFFHQFIQHPGCQLFCSGVLANQTDKHIRCHGAAALLFDFGAELFDFLGQLLLLVLISPGHSGKAFIRDLAGNIVLIDALKEAVQFFITGKECFQLFLFQLAVGFVRLLGVPDNSLQKVVLIEAGKLGQPPNFAR